MDIHELIIEMKLLERKMTLYEGKYSILSEDFYNALISYNLSQYDAYDETRIDLSRWKGIYETWLRRKNDYTQQIQKSNVAETLNIHPAY